MGSIRTNHGKKATTYTSLWRDADGTQHGETFGSRKEAKDALKPKGGEYETAPILVGKKGSVADYASTWIETHPVKIGTREGYRQQLNCWVIPGLGARQLTEVTTSDVYTWMAGLRAAGMSPASQAVTKNVSSALFESALRSGLITSNPVHGVKISKQVARPYVILTIPEYKALLEVIDPRYRLMIKIAVETGARWAELVELHGSDLVGNILTISRNAVEIQQPLRWVVGTPKSGKSRSMAVSDSLAVEIRAAGDGLL